MNEAAAQVLVVDDEPDIRELIALTLERMGLMVQSAANVSQARAMLGKNRFSLCLTDMKLPDGDGLDLVAHIQQTYPKLPVAVITAHGNVETAVRALKNGAFDFVTKPIDLAQLRNLVKSALQMPPPGMPDRDRRSRHILLGESPAMRQLRSQIAKLSLSQAPIFISGESGTGKELVARLLHAKGSRAEKPFVAVNCGAIPPDLMESEFFGHKKGSFTGAVSDKAGLFQAAEGGTLFLDEVADLPLSLQVKLLRAIQEKAIRPVGEQRETAVDVRIVSASHKDLERLVQEGQFREDLFYRINVIQLRVPPLRERPQDIPQLAEHILKRLGDSQRLSPEAVAVLQSLPFPGNVRQLENILERALALCEGNLIEPDDLGLTPPRPGRPEAPPIASAIPEATPSALPEDLDGYKDELEKQAILKALEQTRWNRTAAAKQLGITFRALRYRLKKLGLD